MINHYLLWRQIGKVATPRSLTPQRRHTSIFQYAAAHPEETVVALGAAAAIGGWRIWTLTLQTREQEERIRSQEEFANARQRSFDKAEAGLRAANDSLRRSYESIRDEKRRMEASIVDRGRAGEEVLGSLLGDCASRGVIEGYELQREIAKGKVPDAVAEILDDSFVVIDSKAPNPPTEINQQTRREYADKLKSHVTQLSNRQYHSAPLKQCIPATLMLLPGEGYLSCAYSEGSDVWGINKFARDRNVVILGPHGLRVALQLVRMRLEEQAAGEASNDARVRENIAAKLRPLWIDGLLPFLKKAGRSLEGVVTTWNAIVDGVVEFDAALRSKEMLDLASARKTQLPKGVTAPRTLGERGDS